MTLVYIPEAISVKNFGEESEVLAIPAFPFYIVVIIGCGLLTLVVMIELLKAIQRLTEK
jgi:TRAP-type C4-dicarboxylate transport system permease small subunit